MNLHFAKQLFAPRTRFLSAPAPDSGFGSASLYGISQPNVQWVAITPYATASEWFVDSLGDLGRMTHLPNNWDSYGSPPVTGEAKESAVHIVTSLQGYVADAPRISAVPGGGVQLEWSSGPRAVELEVLPNGEIQFLRVYDEDEMKEGSVSPNRPDAIREQVRWLYA